MGLGHVYTWHLNTTTVVVLQVVFHYEIIYEMGPPMSEKQVKESQSSVMPPLFTQVGVRAWQRAQAKYKISILIIHFSA